MLKTASTSPTNHAAFRQMIKDMSIPELEIHMKLINSDIIKYIEQYGDKRPMSDTREYSEKLNIISQEIKERRQLRLELVA